MKDAMKAKDKTRLTVLRSLKSAIQTVTIEKYGADGELDDAEAITVVRKAIKQRQDSIASFEEAGRDELAAKEKEEMAFLETLLPEPLTEDELVALVEQTIADTGASSRKDMGQVMKPLQEKVAGRADGKTLSKMVSERLG